MSFTIIEPITLTTAMLTSSTATEPGTGETEWNAATAYTTGQVAIRSATHRQYKRLIGGTTATAPESDTTNWIDIGPTNRWAMFDAAVGTATAQPTGPLTVVVHPGSGVGGVYLADVAGRTATVTVKDAPGGSVVSTQTIDLDGSAIGSFYDWFYAPFEQVPECAITNLPAHFTDAEVTISLTGSSAVQCGVCKFGLAHEIGATLRSPKTSIIDYSIKKPDDFGRVEVVERAFSKRASFSLLLGFSDYTRVSRLLAKLRATPVVYIATTQAGFEPLMLYGFYKDFSIDVAYPQHRLCSLELEGLI